VLTGEYREIHRELPFVQHTFAEVAQAMEWLLANRPL